MDEYIELLERTAERVGIEVPEDHYKENSEYYKTQQGQLKNVIEKNLPEEKLKIIFQNLINKLSGENKEESTIQYPPVKIVNTQKYSVYMLSRD